MLKEPGRFLGHLAVPPKTDTNWDLLAISYRRQQAADAASELLALLQKRSQPYPRTHHVVLDIESTRLADHKSLHTLLAEAT